MTAFFDTIKIEVLMEQLLEEGIGKRVIAFIVQMFRKIKAQVETAWGRSTEEAMKGLRQGGRFSTTGGKVIVRRIMNKYRKKLKGWIGLSGRK